MTQNIYRELASSSSYCRSTGIMARLRCNRRKAAASPLV